MKSLSIKRQSDVLLLVLPVVLLVLPPVVAIVLVLAHEGTAYLDSIEFDRNIKSFFVCLNKRTTMPEVSCDCVTIYS